MGEKDPLSEGKNFTNYQLPATATLSIILDAQIIKICNTKKVKFCSSQRCTKFALYSLFLLQWIDNLSPSPSLRGNKGVIETDLVLDIRGTFMLMVRKFIYTRS
jgi:hypothetical protein